MLLQLLSIFVLVATATFTVYVGSKLSVGNISSAASMRSVSHTEDNAEESVELTLSQVIIIPITSSACLLILYFYFAYVQYILLAILILVTSSALLQLVSITIRHYFVRFSDKSIFIFSTFATFVAVVDWIITGNLIIHDILGCALCVTFISTLKFPSLKIATICLILLLSYDVFWVFFSEHFFKSNVMVDVATKVATNPVYEAGVRLNINIMQSAQRTIELPLKLLFRNFATGRVMMLGLGDIALPGALVSLALRCDCIIAKEVNRKSIDDDGYDVEAGNSSNISGGSKERKMSEYKSLLPVASNASKKPSATLLFEYSLSGYLIGLLTTLIAGSISGHAQPALIYLVPGVLLPLVGKAWQIGRLSDVWSGPYKMEQST